MSGQDIGGAPSYSSALRAAFGLDVENSDYRRKEAEWEQARRKREAAELKRFEREQRRASGDNGYATARKALRKAEEERRAKLEDPDGDELNDEDIEAARLLGVDAKKLAAHKKAKRAAELEDLDSFDDVGPGNVARRKRHDPKVAPKGQRFKPIGGDEGDSPDESERWPSGGFVPSPASASRVSPQAAWRAVLLGAGVAPEHVAGEHLVVTSEPKPSPELPARAAPRGEPGTDGLTADDRAVAAVLGIDPVALAAHKAAVGPVRAGAELEG